jgi:hypothetical protein
LRSRTDREDWPELIISRARRSEFNEKRPLLDTKRQGALP